MLNVMKNFQTSESSVPSISLQHSAPEVVQLATNYALDYLDYVENLPFDLQRNVTKLREVDQKCREYVKEIENLYESFIKENDGSTSIRKRTYLLQIRRLFGLCKELGDEKIAIAQSISEVIETRNKQLEHGCKRFKHAYEPHIKIDHNGKKEKDGKSDSGKSHKRSRRQRNNHSMEKQEKIHQHKDQEKVTKSSYYDDTEEPPAKVIAPSSPEPSSITIPTPALTRAAQRDEDKRCVRLSTKKDKKEEKHEKTEEPVSTTSTASTKTSNEASTPAAPSSVTTTSAPSTTSSAAIKQSKNTSANNASTASSSATNKNNNKGKKKKRKSNKHQSEKQSGNSGEVSPIVDIPIDPDEPTYCLCQQVSFGQMIGCDNMKCPIEWFHFSCVRLTHKPKGKWYCPDCTTKRKRDGKRADNR